MANVENVAALFAGEIFYGYYISSLEFQACHLKEERGIIY
jgi:hypothetical protein